MSQADGLASSNVGAIISSKGKILLGGNNGLSIFEENDAPFAMKFDKILTPKAEIPFKFYEHFGRNY